jgi:hypothetical protein
MAGSSEIIQRLLQQVRRGQLNKVDGGGLLNPPPNQVGLPGGIPVRAEVNAGSGPGTVIPPPPRTPGVGPGQLPPPIQPGGPPVVLPPPAGPGGVPVTPFAPQRVRNSGIVPGQRGAVDPANVNNTITNPPAKPGTRPGFKEAAAVGLGLGAMSSADQIAKLYDDRGKVLAQQKQAALDESGLSEEGLESKTKAKIMEGIPEKDQGWFEQLSNEFDMTTFGLSLMASNNGEMNMSQAIGVAMGQARAAKKGDEDRTRRADILERSAQNDKSRADSARIQAMAAITRAATQGQSFKQPNKTALAAMQNNMSILMGNKLDPETRPADAAAINSLATLKAAAEARQNGKPLDDTQTNALIRQYFEDNPELVDPDWFSTGDFTIDDAGAEALSRGQRQAAGPIETPERQALQAQLLAAQQE